MRKPDNSRPGAGGKGRSFKKDSGKTDRKAGGSSRPYSDKPKRDDGGFAGRKERSGDGEKKPRRSFGDSDSPRKPYRAAGDDKPRRSFGGGEDRPYKKPADRDDKPRRSSSDDRPARKPYPRSDDDKGFSSRPRRASGDSPDDKPRRRSGDTEDRPRRSSAGSFDDKPRRRSPGAEDRPRKRAGSDTEKPRRSRDAQSDGKPFGKFAGARGERSAAGRSKPDFADKPRKSYGDTDERKGFKKGKNVDEGVKRVKYDDFEDGKVFSARRTDKKGKGKPVKKAGPPKKQLDDDGMIRLNKYLSNAGVASRREADTLIQSGVVKVNGVVVDQLGTKINPNDKVTYGDAAVRSERKVYLLLNKPKDYITTTDDPQERKTVMELVAKACKERIYPVGRLDRNTTGLLLFTNDGDLTTKLMHPKYQIKKIYHVSLNKGLKPEDFKGITEGIELEDGIIKADDLAFVGEGKKEIGIEIHSGRNRIVRRIFEHLGYEVLKLDRVAFAGLTKKDLPRGKHRFLTAKEIAFLQMVG